MSRPPQSNHAPIPAPDDPVTFMVVEFTAAGQLSDETLAAWLDDPAAFQPADAERIRTHLRHDAASREALDDLQLVVATLGSLPTIEPGRSFALSAQSAHTHRPVVTTRRAARPMTPVVQIQQTNAWQARQQRTLRWASAVAAMLLVFVLSVDAFTGDSSNDSAADKQMTISMSGAAAPVGENDEFIAPSADQSGTAEGYDVPPAAADTGGSADAGESSSDDDDAARNMATADGESSGATLESATGMADETSVPDSTAGEEPAMGMGGDPETAAADTMFLATDQGAFPSATAEEPGTSILQLLEFGLALTVLWLLIALVGLPWIRQQAAYRRR